MTPATNRWTKVASRGDQLAAIRCEGLASSSLNDQHVPVRQTQGKITGYTKLF
jgi:hypothetical protein